MFNRNCTNLTSMSKPHKKKAKWGWSPLYHLLKLFPVQVGPQCPWRHTKEELQNIMLEMDKESHPLSPNMECPHIICTFKLFCRCNFGRLHPLVRANTRFTHHNILHYCQDQSHSVKLTITIQDILDYNFLWFPKQWQYIEEVK